MGSFNLRSSGKGRMQSGSRSDGALPFGPRFSAAPEPRLRRVSAIRLQSLTQEAGGCGHFATAPSSHSSLVDPTSIVRVRPMRVTRHRGLDSSAA